MRLRLALAVVPAAAAAAGAAGGSADTPSVLAGFSATCDGGLVTAYAASGIDVLSLRQRP